MSRKMLKRSLALGALMAFVITGQAWAAELTINSENGNYSVVGTYAHVHNYIKMHYIKENEST